MIRTTYWGIVNQLPCQSQLHAIAITHLPQERYNLVLAKLQQEVQFPIWPVFGTVEAGITADWHTKSNGRCNLVCCNSGLEHWAVSNDMKESKDAECL